MNANGRLARAAGGASLAGQRRQVAVPPRKGVLNASALCGIKYNFTMWVNKR